MAPFDLGRALKGDLLLTEGVALDEKDFDDYIGTYPIKVEI